ncbi:efflux RND transporter permease subunit [Brevibacillus ginsengisoli]|uniref:efflux RND transporter permease subunit n=1 Tax=Brevibacillus ginsengisoli TaxID=363854 RepID=UPI003CF8891F
MEKLIYFLLRRKLIVFLATSLIVLAGLGSLFSFTVALVPKANFPIISVSVTGGSLPPEEMEEKVTKPIEKEIKSIADVKDYTSNTSTGSSFITIKAEEKSGEKVKQDVQNAVNRLRNSFPKSVDTVNIRQDSFGDDNLIDFALSGSDPQVLMTLAKSTLKDKIEAVPGVKEVKVETIGFENKIAVTFKPDQLAAYNITPQDVMNQLQQANWKQAVGTLQNAGYDTVIMIDHSLKTIQDIGNVMIKTQDGPVRIGQLATIDDLRGKMNDAVGLHDGNPFVWMSVKRTADSDLISTQDAVEKVVDEINRNASGSYKMYVMFEAVSFIKHAVNNLSTDVVIGGALAILILIVFLRNWRVTLVIATTLPLSAFMTFIAMKVGGYNIDLVTLISLSLSVGLIVDAAIVVLESIYQFREKGEPLERAIVLGTKEVMTPVIASQITLIAVFLPLVFANFEDWLKPIFMTIAFTVTATIVSSTVAAFFFVPVFAERFLRKDKQGLHSEENHGKKQNKIVQWFNKLLQVALNHRVKTLLVAFLMFVGAIFLAPMVKVELGMNENENFIYAKADLADGTQAATTIKEATAVEKSLRQVPEISDLFVIVEKNSAQFFIQLVGKAERKRNKEEMSKDINDRLNKIQGVDKIAMSFGSQNDKPPVQVDVIGQDLDTTRQLTADVEKMLSTIPGLSNVRDDFQKGTEKITLVPKEDVMEQLNVNPRSMLAQISGFIGEQNVTTITADGIDLDVVARYPKEWMKHPDQLKQLLVTTETGNKVPLTDLVELKYTKSPITLTHQKGDRIVTVSADVLGGDVGAAGRQIEEKLAQFAVPAGYKVEISGKLKEQGANFTALAMVLFGVIALIYMIMVTQFGRLSHPFIIMLTIPMAAVGVIVGFVITQRSFGEMAMIGIIMLVGIVVSNAILLIDRINLLRSRGMDVKEAILQGTKDRIRPVLMTKLTAILGMLPMALAFSEGAAMEAPLATGVIFGLAFHTVVTLILVPVMYSLFESYFARRLARKERKLQRKLERSMMKEIPNS